MRRWAKLLVLPVLITGMIGLLQVRPAWAGLPAQIPTGSIPTVTGTPRGVVLTVTSGEPQVNVRSGPNTTYDLVGVLLPGQEVTAKGRTQAGLWILIDYPGAPGGVGWVYSPNLSRPSGDLPIVEPPPAPTLAFTMTIDPTLAYQFIVTPAPTRLATFTPPPPLVVPTLPRAGMVEGTGGIPMGLVIVILAGLGVFLGLISLVRGR